MGSWKWWLWHIFIALSSGFFLVLGIDTLVSAYALSDPHFFIVYFFSSNLLILVSTVGLLYCFFRFYAILKYKNIGQDQHG